MRHGSATGAALLVAFLLVGLLAAPAAAHVTASPDVADTADFRIAFRVGHGCEGSPTTVVRVRIPVGVADPEPEDAPGWDAELTQVTDSGEEGEATEVTWARGPSAGEVMPDLFLSGRFTDGADDVVYFPLVQECEQGEHRWIDIPPSLEEWGSLEEPAPYVRLAFRDDGDAGGTGADADEQSQETGDTEADEEASPEPEPTPEPTAEPTPEPSPEATEPGDDEVLASGPGDDEAGSSSGLLAAGVVVVLLGLAAGVLVFARRHDA